MFALVKDVKENLPLDVGTSFSLQTCWHMLACVGIRWQWAWEAWVAFLWTFALRFERLPLGVLLEEPNFLLLSAGVLLNLAQSHCRILRSHRLLIIGVDRKFLMCPLRPLRSLSCFKLQGMTSEVYPSSGSSDCLQELRVVTGFTKIRSYKQCHLD